MMNRFQLKIALLLLLTTGVGLAIGGEKFTKVGTTGFVFLEIPVSARSVALGETGIGLMDAGVDGLFFNPALIATQNQRIAVSATHSDWYVGTTHQALATTLQASSFGTIGFQIINFDFGIMTKTRNPTSQEQGSYVEMGSYSAGASAIGLSFARFLTDRFSFGTTLKYVQENIDVHKADNVVIDIGFLYLTGYGNLRIATCLQNFGLETQYVSEKFKMPQKLTLGMATEIFGDPNDARHVTLMLEAVHPNDIGEHLHLGLEGVLGVLQLRTGYKFGYEDEGLSAGLGLNTKLGLRELKMDFSYANHRYLDTTMRYSIMIGL